VLPFSAEGMVPCAVDRVCRSSRSGRWIVEPGIGPWPRSSQSHACVVPGPAEWFPRRSWRKRARQPMVCGPLVCWGPRHRVQARKDVVPVRAPDFRPRWSRRPEEGFRLRRRSPARPLGVSASEVPPNDLKNDRGCCASRVRSVSRRNGVGAVSAPAGSNGGPGPAQGRGPGAAGRPRRTYCHVLLVWGYCTGRRQPVERPLL